MDPLQQDFNVTNERRLVSASPAYGQLVLIFIHTLL